MTTAHKVAILMGSDSDLEVMKESAEVLKKFGVSYDLNVLSAHRSPGLVAQYASAARQNGFGAVICGAGGAAHLAGVVAAHTTLPVIGVPIDATALNGLDALLATVQMPAGIPVATVAIGKPGARNAGILAVQILALADAGLAARLEDFKKEMEKGVQDKNRKLKENPPL
ncbi:MAG: 5-(carboxyamino)imidazole ribonucleotide mutase [Candidatus Omnitrophota bacterium]|jgi:phosphoribosylaminoimidazole carboxylase PurE protein